MSIPVSGTLPQGKHVEGNQEGATKVKKTRTWRQYMNRFVTSWIPWTLHSLHTPSSRGGFNRSVTCMSTEISLCPYCTFIGHWTRSSSLPPMTICETVLLGPVECFHVVFELWYSSPVFSFPCFSESHISDESKCLTPRARIQRTVHIIHNY